MDDLDATILRELSWAPDDPRDAVRGVRPPSAIARACGIHGSTLKRRLAAMRESGMLRGFRLQPAPSLLGLRGQEHVLSFPDAAATARGVATLVADPRVWTCRSFLDHEVLVHTATPLMDEGREPVAELAAVSGATRGRFRRDTGWALPVDRISALDLRVLAAFALDAYRPIGEAAQDVGVSAKSVRNRLSSLAKARAFTILADVDDARPEAGLTVQLDVSLAPGAWASALREIANRFPHAFGRSAGSGESAQVVHLARSATEFADLLTRAEAIPGATRVRPQIVRQTRHEPTRWKEALLTRAEEISREKGMWSAPWRATPLVARRSEALAAT